MEKKSSFLLNLFAASPVWTVEKNPVFQGECSNQPALSTTRCPALPFTFPVQNKGTQNNTRQIEK